MQLSHKVKKVKISLVKIFLYLPKKLFFSGTIISPLKSAITNTLYTEIQASKQSAGKRGLQYCCSRNKQTK